ncbi:MAG: YceI family protein [Blastocatellia bacterium]|nr:YceI family protein [Blastocatellia bacterium]
METQTVSREQANHLWKIDSAHTTVEFAVRNLFLFTVRGRFTGIAGTILFDEDELGRSSVEASIKAKSIDTGNRRRDAHLCSADFLNVEQYPEIRFQSTKVEKGRDRDTLRITGELTIAGKSREMTFEVTEVERSRSPQGEEVAYYSLLIKLDRRDFGVSYGRLITGRTVTVTIHLQAVRRTEDISR